MSEKRQQARFAASRKLGFPLVVLCCTIAISFQQPNVDRYVVRWDEEERPSVYSSSAEMMMVAEPNKTLVVAIGSTNAGDETTWNSMFKELLDPNQADLAVFLDQEQPLFDCSLTDRAKYAWRYNLDEAPPKPEGYDWLAPKAVDMFRQMAPLAAHLGPLTEQYDRFIITRSDFFHVCRMVDCDATSICFLADGSLILPSSQLEHALGLLPDILVNTTRYEGIPVGQPGDPLQSVLSTYFDDRNIKVQRRPSVMFATTTDPSATLVPEGVRYVYRADYVRSRESCGNLYPPQVQRIPPVPVIRRNAEQSKTLVILIGNLRGGEAAWQSLYRNLLNVNDADLALMIGETAPQYQNASLFQHADYQWTFPEYDDWSDALDLINGTAWRQTLIPLLHHKSRLLGGIKAKAVAGSGAVIFMIRWFLAHKIRELDLTSKYERFVITRSDHFYYCEHDLSDLDNNHMWVPEGQDYGGVTDRHLVVSSEHVLQALNILPPLLSHPEQYADVLNMTTFNPEKLILRQWKNEGIQPLLRRFPRMMFTCAQSGDSTRWMKMQTPIKEGVNLKYVDEYYDSELTCFNRKTMKV